MNEDDAILRASSDVLHMTPEQCFKRWERLKTERQIKQLVQDLTRLHGTQILMRENWTRFDASSVDHFAQKNDNGKAFGWLLAFGLIAGGFILGVCCAMLTRPC